MSNLRAQTIRLASTFPAKSEQRRALLAALRQADDFRHVAKSELDQVRQAIVRAERTLDGSDPDAEEIVALIFSTMLGSAGKVLQACSDGRFMREGTAARLIDDRIRRKP